MRHGGAAVLAGLMAAAALSEAAAQNTRVPREQSSILIDMPGLENGAEQYDYLGWDSRFAVERHFAAQTARGANFPRAQFAMRRLAKGFVWAPQTLDEAYVRNWPFFRDRKLELLRSGDGSSSAYIQTLAFRADGAECVALTMRHVPAGRMDSQPEEGTAGFDGYYCAAPGEAMTQALVAAVASGIYVRQGTQIRRANEADASPIPSRVATPR